MLYRHVEVGHMCSPAVVPRLPLSSMAVIGLAHPTDLQKLPGCHCSSSHQARACRSFLPCHPLVCFLLPGLDECLLLLV